MLDRVLRVIRRHLKGKMAVAERNVAHCYPPEFLYEVRGVLESFSANVK
jgi:hypothetical protein